MDPEQPDDEGTKPAGDLVGKVTATVRVHSPDCDSLDPMVRTKPCNCSDRQLAIGMLGKALTRDASGGDFAAAVLHEERRRERELGLRRALPQYATPADLAADEVFYRRRAPDGGPTHAELADAVHFDGQPFFSASHPIDQPAPGYFSNFATSSPLTLANFKAAIAGARDRERQWPAMTRLVLSGQAAWQYWRILTKYGIGAPELAACEEIVNGSAADLAERTGNPADVVLELVRKWSPAIAERVVADWMLEPAGFDRAAAALARRCNVVGLNWQHVGRLEQAEKKAARKRRGAHRARVGRR